MDAAKGCVAALIGQSFGPDLAIIAAWGAVLGHLFPVWLKFKGGKGGATALGVGIGLVPILALYAGLTWLAVAILLRYSSLATLLAIAAAPIYAWLLGYHQIAEAFVPIALLIWLKHHANIRRLLAGEESKIKLNPPNPHIPPYISNRYEAGMETGWPDPTTDVERLARLRLNRTRNVGPATFRTFLNKFGSAEKALMHYPNSRAGADRINLRLLQPRMPCGRSTTRNRLAA